MFAPSTSMSTSTSIARTTSASTGRRALPAALVIALLLVLAVAGPARAERSLNPAQLTRAGWDCFNGPADFNPNVHCSPPGQLARIVSHEAVAGFFLTFDTVDLADEDATFLGTERLIRADRYNGQPCPTDPPSLTYSNLLDRLGLDYYICHVFDSPW